MLLDGELDAAVVGGPDLNEPRLRPVISNPAEAAQIWCQRHGALPINHMVVIKESLRKSNPSAVKEIYRVLRKSKQAAPAPGALDPLQFGTENVRRSLELIIEYSVQQRLIPRRIEVNELFDEVTRGLN
jgi:4,5-dihydroxyphthalate decarboxylase